VATDPNEASRSSSAAEVRHRAANTLQLLGALARMRSQKAAEPEARRQLLWLADAVGSLGALEQKRGEGGVAFAPYLAEMAPIWRRRHSGCLAEVTVEADPLMVPDHAASTLGLVVQELVANAMSHGFPDGRAGQVRIRFAELPDGRRELSVSDDGVGFDPTLPAGRERFGLWFVRSLASQVRGEFILTTRPGVVGVLRFPA
jgi:two-component sensor histidine kinase